MNRNYQKELDKIIKSETDAGNVPRLFLHSCCAPCSSYCLEYLTQYFSITDFYYNPNIMDEGEYRKRIEEIKRLIGSLPMKYPVSFVEGRYEPGLFMEAVKGYEMCREGGERCGICFELRLKEAVRLAEEGNFDYVTTTLTISPLKNAALLNEIGERLCEGHKVKWLPSDFKKRGGYQRSIRLSKEYNLYRQDYCGCVFSKRRDYGKLKNNSAPGKEQCD